MTVAEVAQGLWSIPSTWVWVAMGDVAIVVGGGTPSTAAPSNFASEGIPWITPADLSGFTDKYISRGRRDISDRGFKTSNATLLPAGAVLLSSRAPVGYAAIASGPLTTNQGFKSFALKGELFPDYVYYYMRYSRGYLESLSGGTTFKELSGAAAKRVLIPIAPLPEQHRIVAEVEKQFTRLDAAAASLQRARANLKRYRASVLKAACEGRLVPTEAELASREGRAYEPASILLERILKERRARWEAEQRHRGEYKEPQPPDTTKLPLLPEGWVWATAIQMAESTLGKMLDQKRTFGRPLPYLRNLNVRWNAFDLGDLLEMPFKDGELDRYGLKAGDVLVCEGGEPGRAAVWPDDEQPIKYQKALHRVRLQGGIEPRWLVFNLWNDGKSGRLERYFTGTTIKHFTGVSFERYSIPLPPLAEQQRIVAEVERHLSVIEAAEAVVEANLKRAERLRQAILQRAFQGKLVPQDPIDEPASVLLERIRAEREKSDMGHGGSHRSGGRRSKFQAEGGWCNAL